MQQTSYCMSARAIRRNIGTRPRACGPRARCQYSTYSPCTHAITSTYNIVHYTIVYKDILLMCEGNWCASCSSVVNSTRRFQNPLYYVLMCGAYIAEVDLYLIIIRTSNAYYVLYPTTVVTAYNMNWKHMRPVAMRSVGSEHVRSSQSPVPLTAH